jgi:hypothetical protein
VASRKHTRPVLLCGLRNTPTFTFSKVAEFTLSRTEEKKKYSMAWRPASSQVALSGTLRIARG